MKKVFFILLSVINFVLCDAQVTNKVGHDKMLNRFLSYVKIESQSVDDDDMTSFPLTEGQQKIARFIYDEVTAMNGKNVKTTLSQDSYVYIDIPSNTTRPVPSVLFMAHLDVTPEAPGTGIKPIVHRNYNGGDLVLPGGITLSPNAPEGAHLKDLVGKTIVTSDGNTLLGADDKTGCAVLISLVEELIGNPGIEHGRVMVALSQNEDVGKAALRYDPNVFGDRPYVVIDVDGDTHDKFSIANFSAIGQTFYFKGNDVHPGHAKEGKYADALTAAAHFIGLIPPEINPSERDAEQGYIHCYSMEHPVNENGDTIFTDYVVKVRLRYFDRKEGEFQKQLINDNLAKTQQAFPNVRISKTGDQLQYENIAYTMPAFLPAIIEKASRSAGIPMTARSERGGTTSAMMVAQFPDAMPGGSGIYSGQQAEHSRYEWTCVEELTGLVNVCESIIAEIVKMDTTK